MPLPPGPGIKNSQWIVVRQDLKDKVKSVADLKGLKVGLNNVGTLNEEQLDRSLEANGLKADDVSVTAVPFPDQLVALSNKGLDAAVMVEPFVSQAQAKGIGFPLYDTALALPGHPGQYLFYAPEFIKNNPDAGRRFMVAYLKAMRYIQDAWVKGINKDEVIALHIKYTSVKDPQLWQTIGLSYYETDGRIDTQAIGEDEDFFIAKGGQKARVDVANVIDPSFGQYAESVLGPYKK